jgi:NAD(P)-dependent dehydrogenase (short-subunit alcohol dehydrogenase family)
MASAADAKGQPVCVVTGGSAGIGLAVARHFAARSYRIAICGRNPQTLRTAEQEIAQTAPACLALALDLAEAEAPNRLVAEAVERFGRVDVLVNNAGHAPLAPLDQLSGTDFERAVAVNIRAVFHATQAVWPIMRQQGGGVIVNVSSLASVDPFPGFSVYGACKAWVNLFTKAAADEGRALGIRVYCVAPGAVETRLLRGLFKDFPAEQTLAPDDIAALIGSLCDEPMRYASGQTLLVRK